MGRNHGEIMNVVDKLKEFGEVYTDVALKQCTTLRIGGEASMMLHVATITSLLSAHQWLLSAQIPYKVIGKGSNLLCSDDRYEGCIIRLDRKVHHHYIVNDSVWVEAGASVVSLAFTLAKHNLAGFEWASGIPATIGGAIANNAGAYHQCMADHVSEVMVSTPEGLITLSNQECEFSYRNSIFHQQPDWIILAAKLTFSPGNYREIMDLIKFRQHRRMTSQPLEFPSAGSTFRNFEDQSAWSCIEEAGCKGLSIGGAQVSKKHSNFLVNVQDASAMDMLQLIEEVRQRVLATCGRELILEVERFNWNKKTQ